MDSVIVPSPVDGIDMSGKILFITHHYLQGNGGGIYASRGFINAMARLAEVTLLCPVKEGCFPEQVDPSVRQIHVAYDLPKWRKALDLLLGRIHRYFGVLDKVLAEQRYDTVVFDTCYPSFRMIGKVRRAGCRVITIHHNYQFEYARGSYTFPLLQVMLFWLYRCEGQAVRGSDLNLTLTAEDRELLYTHYDPSRRARIEVAGVHEYKPEPLPEPSSVEDPVFIITGSLSTKQSEDSLIPWLEHYYPLLRERVPDARLIIAGQAPSSRLVAKCRLPGIELVASPPEMQPLLRRARYYICPTDRGGGIKLRVMDGLRNGLPVLAHAVSARGYAPFQDTVLFSYSDRDSFRSALESLLSVRLDSASVQERYARYFSFGAGVERLSEWLDPQDNNTSQL